MQNVPLCPNSDFTYIPPQLDTQVSGIALPYLALTARCYERLPQDYHQIATNYSTQTQGKNFPGL